MTKDAWALANEIYNVGIIQNLEIEEDAFPHILELIISYHMNKKKIPRKVCGWGCAELDENSPDGWYDGVLCPTCGYVRGMDGYKKFSGTIVADRYEISGFEIADGNIKDSYCIKNEENE